MTSLTNQFSYQLYLAGLETNDTIIADGLLHRFHILGDTQRGTKK